MEERSIRFKLHFPHWRFINPKQALPPVIRQDYFDKEACEIFKRKIINIFILKIAAWYQQIGHRTKLISIRFYFYQITALSLLTFTALKQNARGLSKRSH